MNETPWGGSEELWFETALELASEGARVQILKPRLPAGCDRLARLRQAGCHVIDLARPLGLPYPIYGQMVRFSRLGAAAWLLFRVAIALLRSRPHLVVLSQGGNWDGAHFAIVLRMLRVPFVVISQKASELYWPPDVLRERVQKMYRRALHAFFVSRHNLELTEMQVGEKLPQASVVRNPFLIPYCAPLPWPEDRDGAVKIACVGRLYLMEKGQDLLLQLLAMPKWRNRNIQLTFYGEGVNRETLEDIVRLLDLQNVRFAGQVEDVAHIWNQHQVLVLPSRAEGLPLVIVEAMLAGRVVVATHTGGNGEIFADNVSGFLASAPNVAALDEAMERAWAQRRNWQDIAEAASRQVRQLVPRQPGRELAGVLFAEAAAIQSSGPASASPKLGTLTAPPTPAE